MSGHGPIDLHALSVLSLSEEQMNALVGLRYVQTPSDDPQVRLL